MDAKYVCDNYGYVLYINEKQRGIRDEYEGIVMRAIAPIDCYRFDIFFSKIDS